LIKLAFFFDDRSETSATRKIFEPRRNQKRKKWLKAASFQFFSDVDRVCVSRNVDAECGWNRSFENWNQQLGEMLFAETEKRIDKNGAMQAHRFCNRSSVERHETGNAAIWLFVKFVDNEGVLFDGKKNTQI
jgi:hypothetical protein